ncbi:MAG TPA: FmdB family zinc ribbon protein [Candidatus Dormibacteraeota bacterium]|nr:FmdB family zinc ribbon protein [Candidatus Dormibacteraeota bacterium]
MPLYDYRCTKCGKVSEVRHGFGEPFAGTCPVCGGPLQRVFNPAPIVFKGSGFYATDSRKKSDDASTSTDAKSEKPSDAKPGDAKPGDAKPADPKPEKPSGGGTPSDSAA